MNIIFAILGTTLIVLISIDILWTTLLIAGAGPITNYVTFKTWSLFLYFHKSSNKHKLLSYSGLLVIVLNLLVWVGTIWLGWVLVFSSAPEAVVHSSNLIPANFWSRVYFTGYTLITLGVGDYVAGNNFWEVITILAAANGFFFVTLAITYLLPLVSAVVQKRTLGGIIASLGKTPHEIILNGWDGKSFSLLHQYFPSLTDQIISVGQKHLAYPILHCFHTHHREVAAAPNIAALDEALTILISGTNSTTQSHQISMTLRSAITYFLAIQSKIHVKLSDEIATPDCPDFDILNKNGIETISKPAFQAEADKISQRRRLLNALIIHDGWQWKDVTNPQIVSTEKANANPLLIRDY